MTTGAVRICGRCIAEPLLAKLTEDLPAEGACSFCGRCVPTCDLSAVADEVERVFHDCVVIVDGGWSLAGDSDHVDWTGGGERPSTIVSELMGCSEDVAAAIVGILRAGNAYAVHVDGETDWFDDGREDYAIAYRRSARFDDLWTTLCETVKHEHRFFNVEADRILGELLGAAIEGRVPGLPSPVVWFGGPDTGELLHRGRQADGHEDQRRIFASPAGQFGAPPPHLRTAGRMNPSGIAALYASLEATTCVAELRAPVGSEVAVATIESVRPLKLLDLRQFADATPALPSVFDPNFFEHLGIVDFLRRFQSEVRRAVLPGTAHVDYVPTQCVAEYLAGGRYELDGVMVASAQVSGGTNVVLFAHACRIDPTADEEMAGFQVDLKPDLATDEDDDESRLAIERIAPSRAAREAAIRGLTVELPFGFDRPAARPAPVLRLVPGGLRIIRPVAIAYQVEEIAVVIKEPVFEDEMRALPF